MFATKKFFSKSGYSISGKINLPLVQQYLNDFLFKLKFDLKFIALKN